MDPKKIAIVIIDMQRDFCKDGSLAVPEADRLIRPINRIKKAAQASGSLVFASPMLAPAKKYSF